MAIQSFGGLITESPAGEYSMKHVLQLLALIGVVLSGAIFGFFYAWVCSTLWGLDAIDPRAAIEAMQAMNVSVRNPVFFPAFFLTPVTLGLTTILALGTGARPAAAWFGGATAFNLFFVIFITAQFNLPLNEALAVHAIPEARAEAVDIWAAYSPPWQAWNTIRAAGSGLALLLSAVGLSRLDSFRRRLISM
jgi:uncharacterized membrane protein